VKHHTYILFPFASSSVCRAQWIAGYYPGGALRRFAFIILFLIPLLFATCGLVQAQMPVIAYHPTWWQGSLKPSMIDFSSLTHIIIFPAQDASSSSPYFNGSALSMGGDLAQIVTLAHAKGCKVLISAVGGYGQTQMPIVAADAAKCQAFVNAAVAYAQANGCDGVECDWEFPRSGDATGWKNLITKFRAALDAWTPHGILITSGYYSDLGAPYNVADMNANVDFVVPMTYTMWMGSGAGPYKSGYDTPVGLPTQWTGYSGYSLSSPAGGGPLTYLNDGYTPSKVAVSISFEGTQFSGVGGKMGVAYSSYAFCSTVSKSLGAYAAIPASGRAWDATAQAAYCISGSTVYSYQTPQSVTAIVSWAKTQGFGAIMIYDLGAGYEATAGAADPQALLHAIWQTANGTVSLPPTGTFGASPATLPTGGGTVTLTWTSSTADSASIDNGIGTVALNGSKTVTVSATTTFHLSLTSTTGRQVYAATVTVGTQQAPTGTFTVTPTSLPAGGGSATLQWSSTGATSASIDNGIGSVATSGSRAVTVTSTTIFHLTLTNGAGSAAYADTVTVAQNPPTGTLSATPSSFAAGGGNVTLQWTSTGATSAAIDQGIGTVALSGSRNVQVSSTTIFHLTLANSAGSRIYADTVTVVAPVGAPTGTFGADPIVFPLGGGSVTLTWTSTNAASAAIDNGIGSVPVNGSITRNVTGTTEFHLSLTNTSGTQIYTAIVTVAPSGSLVATPASLPPEGGSVTLTWTSVDATSAGIDQGIGAVSFSGSQSIHVAATTVFHLSLTNSAGSTVYADTVAVASRAPQNFSLEQNYPNPFNPTTNIIFKLPAETMVRLTVYTLLGQEVITLVNQRLPAGTYPVPFDSRNLSTGTYFYTLVSGDYAETRRMVVVK
jgi:GH18 family chitinase